MKSITVCVSYDDFLGITLPRNAPLFDRTLIVTSPMDRETQAVAAQVGCEVYLTNAFYRNGASFNKGLAMEEGFCVLGRDGWICIWDPDIIMPSDISIPDMQEDCLYSPVRHILQETRCYSQYPTPTEWERLPSPTPSGEFSGYFQLFHASAVEPPWYGITWSHAGGCDSDFQLQFPSNKWKRPPFSVMHLGPEGMPELHTRVGRNWCGRVTPRIDTGAIAPTVNDCATAVERMVRERNARGLGTLEKIESITWPEATSPRCAVIPRTMAFFWSGPMSWLRWMTLATFRQHNPDWEIDLYCPAQDSVLQREASPQQGDNEWKGEDYRSRLSELGIRQIDWESPTTQQLLPAQMCDLWQWWHLSSSGGFMADMDVLWLQSLESLWSAVCDSDAMFCLEAGWLAIGFFASRPGCPIFSDVYARAVAECDKRNPADYQSLGTHLLYRCIDSPSRDGEPPGVSAMRELRNRYSDLRVTTVPDEAVYPFDWRQIKLIFEEEYPVPDRTLGVHWFGGSEISQKWNGILTEENWRQHHNTLMRSLSGVME